MDKQRQLENLTQKSLTEFSRAKACVIGKVATGNTVRWNDRFFIVTCEHVASDFVDGNLDDKILFMNNVKLHYKDVSLAAYTKKFDIAILKIEKEFETPYYYELQNFNFIEDFSKANFTETNFFFCGYPSEIIERESKGICFKYFSYMTISYKKISHQKDFLYCEYPMNSFVIDNESDKKRTPPNPIGMSGSFVFQIQKFTGNIWLPDFAKIIAMQIKWDKKSFLKCTNIKFLKEMFEQIVY